MSPSSLRPSSLGPYSSSSAKGKSKPQSSSIASAKVNRLSSRSSNTPDVSTSTPTRTTTNSSKSSSIDVIKPFPPPPTTATTDPDPTAPLRSLIASTAPSWRPLLSDTSDAGYPDFYPSRPGHGQPEDILSESGIKNGYTRKYRVVPSKSESVSKHEEIAERLKGFIAKNTRARVRSRTSRSTRQRTEITNVSTPNSTTSPTHHQEQDAPAPASISAAHLFSSIPLNDHVIAGGAPPAPSSSTTSTPGLRRSLTPFFGLNTNAGASASANTHTPTPGSEFLINTAVGSGAGASPFDGVTPSNPSPRAGPEPGVLGSSGAGGVVNPSTMTGQSPSSDSEIEVEIEVDPIRKLTIRLEVERAKKAPDVPPSTFRLPTRVVYNESMRNYFLSELSDPTIPLSRLSRSIPHGFKTIDVLSLAVSKQIALERAIWFIHVLGAHEVQAIRMKQKVTAGSTGSALGATNLPTLSPSVLYTIEFSRSVWKTIQKQIRELQLPERTHTPTQTRNHPNQSTPPSGMISRGILADRQETEKWTRNWEYSQRLVQQLGGRNLLHDDTLASLLAEELESCNLAQLGFVADLASAYVDFNGLSLYTGRSLIKTIGMRLEEIDKHVNADLLIPMKGILYRVIQNASQADPEFCLIPDHWPVLALSVESFRPGSSIKLKPRNDFLNLEQDDDLGDQETVKDLPTSCLQILSNSDCRSDAFQIVADIRLAFSDIGVSSDHAALIVIQSLLTWFTYDIKSSEFSSHLAIQILQVMREDDQRIDIGRPIFNWIDDFLTQSSASHRQRLARLFGMLFRADLVFPEEYMRYLISKGFSYRQHHESERDRVCHEFVRSIPGLDASVALASQREMVLFGFDGEVDDEERQIQLSTQAIVAFIDHGNPIAQEEFRLSQQSVYMQHHIAKNVRDHCQQRWGDDDSNIAPTEVWIRLVWVLEEVEDWEGIWALFAGRSLESGHLRILANSFLRHTQTWNSLKLEHSIAFALKPLRETPGLPSSLTTELGVALEGWATTPADGIDETSPAATMPANSASDLGRLTPGTTSLPDLLGFVRNIHAQTSLSNIQRMGNQLRRLLATKTIDYNTIWQHVLLSFDQNDVTYLQPEGQRHAIWAVRTLLASIVGPGEHSLRRLMRFLPANLYRMLTEDGSSNIIDNIINLLVDLVVSGQYHFSHVIAEVVLTFWSLVIHADSINSQALIAACQLSLDLFIPNRPPVNRNLSTDAMDDILTMCTLLLRSEEGIQCHVRLLRYLQRSREKVDIVSAEGEANQTLWKAILHNRIIRKSLLSTPKLLASAFWRKGTKEETSFLLEFMAGETDQVDHITREIQTILRNFSELAIFDQDLLLLRIRLLFSNNKSTDLAEKWFDCLATNQGSQKCRQICGELIHRMGSKFSTAIWTAGLNRLQLILEHWPETSGTIEEQQVLDFLALILRNVDVSTTPFLLTDDERREILALADTLRSTYARTTPPAPCRHALKGLVILQFIIRHTANFWQGNAAEQILQLAKNALQAQDLQVRDIAAVLVQCIPKSQISPAMRSNISTCSSEDVAEAGSRSNGRKCIFDRPPRDTAISPWDVIPVDVIPVDSAATAPSPPSDGYSVADPIQYHKTTNASSLSLDDFGAKYTDNLLPLPPGEISRAAASGETWLLCRSEREVRLSDDQQFTFLKHAAHQRLGRIWSIDRSPAPGSPEESLELAITSAMMDKARKVVVAKVGTTENPIEVGDDDGPQAGARVGGVKVNVTDTSSGMGGSGSGKRKRTEASEEVGKVSPSQKKLGGVKRRKSNAKAQLK